MVLNARAKVRYLGIQSQPAKHAGKVSIHQEGIGLLSFSLDNNNAAPNAIAV